MIPNAEGEAGLPYDLLLWDILPRLPLHDLARCRCVCRLWNTSITSAAFQASYSQAHQPWLLCFDGIRGDCCAYNPHFARWVHLPLAGPPADWCHHTPLTAAGSLLLYTNSPDLAASLLLDTDNSDRPRRPRFSLLTPRFDPSALPPPPPLTMRLAVCNPFTGSWRELPPPIQPRRHPFVAVVDIVTPPFNLHNAHFKVLIAGGFVNRTLVSSTEIYDSLTDSWSIKSIPHEYASILHHDKKGRRVACCDGIIYCLASGTSILAYEWASGVWRKDLVFDVKKGMWDRLKWRVECHSQQLILARGSSGRGLLLTAVGALNSPHVCIMGLPYCPDSNLVRWTEDMVHQPPPPPLQTASIQCALTSATALYITRTLAEQTTEVLYWNFMHPSSPASEWSVLPPCPLKQSFVHHRFFLV